MNKTEITNLITTYLSKSPITLVDLLDKNARLDSYEKYVQELTLVKNTFKNDIPEYSNEAVIYLTKMDKFVSACESSSTVENYINSNLRSQICGSSNSSIRPRLISPNSLSNAPERTDSALKQIYHELGPEQLNHYIQLLKTPHQLSSYLADSNKQRAAMHYILYATNHHSTTKLSRNMSTQNLFNLMNSSINDSIKEITSEKDDYINFMNQEKENYTSWFNQSSEQFKTLYDNSEQKYQDFLQKSKNQLIALEKTYSEKLKVEAPSDFMKKKSEDYKKQACRWAGESVNYFV